MTLFKPKRYRLPGGQIYNLLDDMAEQPHLLIAGATGSGKSVLLNGIIQNLLHKAPNQAQLILIDPKRVELARYKSVPHCIRYASEAADMVDAVRSALSITERRYREMQKQGLLDYGGRDVYLIIDELAALMTTQKKAVLPLLQQLGQIGRAARVHMIACTQTVKADVLPTPLTCNFDSRVALRTSTAQQSRMIIDISGCECFPSPRSAGYALCFYRRGADLDCFEVPRYSDEASSDLINYWSTRRCWA